MHTVIYEILQISVCNAASLFVTTTVDVRINGVYGKSVRGGCVGTSKQRGERRRVNVYKAVETRNECPGLTSRVAKDRESRSKHDKYGNTNTEKCRVYCGSSAIAAGALPTCQGIS
jgi:hypothetical protein